MLTQFAGAAIGALAAACLFLFLHNRWLLHLKDSMLKTSAILTLFTVLVGGSTLAGWLLGVSIWLSIPLLILLVLSGVEMRRFLIRRRYRGTAPVSRENAISSIWHPVTTTDIQTIRYNVDCPNWEGTHLTVAQIGDIHMSDALPPDYYQTIVERVNETEPDIILITGDFVTKVKFAEHLPDMLTELHARLGVYAILGNHDYWANADVVESAVLSSGIVLLGDGSRRISHASANNIVLCGCEAPWSGRHWRRPEFSDDDLVLALSHTPDNIYMLSRAGIKAVFAGHYHGGQIRLPGVGAFVIPSKYGRRFDNGHFVVDGTHLFVSAGVGVMSPPLRIYCQPDIIVVKLIGRLRRKMNI